MPDAGPPPFLRQYICSFGASSSSDILVDEMASSLNLDIFSEDPKRKRNRLAQRRHRQQSNAGHEREAPRPSRPGCFPTQATAPFPVSHGNQPNGTANPLPPPSYEGSNDGFQDESMVAFEDLLHDTGGNRDSDNLEVFDFNDFHGGPDPYSGPARAVSGVAMPSGHEPHRAEQKQTPKLGTLEAKFEHILHTVEEAGFESFDDLLTQYYTARFREDTVAYWAQCRNRNRFLHTFLAALHEDAGSWSDREAQGHRQHIACVAERLYVSEFAYAKGHRPMAPNVDVSSVWRARPESSHDDEQTVPPEYAEQVSHAIGLLRLRGITVIQTLAGKGPGSVCLSNDGEERPEFTPQFPASCPYITGVGEVNQSDPLAMWNISSGGFSSLFPRPWYREEAIEGYFENHADKDALQYYRPFFNRSGRGSPDLSLMGFPPEYQGDFISPRPQPSGGTRGNAAWAGLVALLNDSRLRAGLPAMGFTNPWLYKTGIRGLKDITEGGSLGCMGENIQFHRPITGSQRIPWVGWNATKGWDPATGLGFPDFQRLRRLATQIDSDRKRCPPRWWKCPWYWQAGSS